MYQRLVAPLFCICLLIGGVLAQAPVREVLTNDSIINLTKAGFKENTIINLIRSSPVSFDITTTKLVTLKKSRVSEKVISAMIERQNMNATAAFENELGSLGDDEFFKQGDEDFFKKSGPIFREAPGSKSGAGQPRDNETSIFGSQSGGGSKNRSRGMGPNGSSENVTETTGSASVRIIRPPSEGSLGGPKLERQPKLDNKTILDLIQAGFSEGTILRKIENSQVEFDISPKALADLRKNRVSEAVIKAMSEAMGIEMK